VQLAGVVLAGAAAIAGCELFGLGTIRCQGDEFCPTGYRCAERVCVPVSDVFGNPVDAGVTFDAAWTGEHVEIKCTAPPCCRTEPCSLMPDSATQYCSQRGGQRQDCPTDPTADYYGEDGFYDTGAPDYELPGGDIVIDHVTGLIWEQAPGNDVGGGSLLWHEARDYCAALTLTGRSWRLPSYRELVTLVDYGMYIDRHALLDELAFPLTSSAFWSASGYDGNYWWLEFGAGSNGIAADSTNSSSGHLAAARCVSGSAQVGGEFEFITSEGDWLDVHSGLAWSCETATDLSWVDALAFCESSTRASHDDWRLPSVKELETRFDRALPERMYTLAGCRPETAGMFWSSSPCVHTYGTWTASLYGYTGCTDYSTAAVLCVRSQR